eukprot:5533059-Heterocapsa_arctica.AAC.1
MEPIGPHFPQVENLAGYHLRKFAADAGLALANTWFQPAAGPTWAGPNNIKNRIDYIAVPKRLLDNVTYCRVAYNLAVQLQAAATTKWLDHAPVMIDFLH